MGEGSAAVTVADGEDAWDGGVELVVDGDEPAVVRLDACRGEVEVVADACLPVAAADIAQGGPHLRAFRQGVAASRAEGAAGGRAERARDVAGQYNAFAPQGGIRDRRG